MNMDHSNLIQPVNGKIAGYRKLRTGMVYRSAAISSAEQMDDLKPAAILDLRTELEASSKPLFVPEGCAYYRISMLSENAPGEDAGVCAEGTSCHERRTDAYLSSIVFGNPAIQKMFDLLLEEQMPLLLECSTGTYLTGTMSMLLVLALGASAKTALSFYSPAAKKQQSRGLFASIRSALRMDSMNQSVHETIAEKELALIRKNYDTYEMYFSCEYGLNSDRMDRLSELLTVESMPEDRLIGFPESEEPLIRLHCIVSGKVQGVGFRAFASSEAAAWNVTGSADNLPDGTVSLHVQGDPEEVHSFLVKLSLGNQFAEVRSIRCEEEKPVPGETGFRYQRYHM